MKHIVSFSGGKDSTAMLLIMLEKGWQVDEVVFCDTGMEFPGMYKHIDQVEKRIERKIKRLTPEKSFHYYMFEHVKQKGKNMGHKGYGWPTAMGRWCTDRLKVRPTKRYLKGNKNVVLCLGIAADEAERTATKTKEAVNSEKVAYPLVEWGMTEKECLEYCYREGFDWNGLYEQFNRVSCWCCPLQPRSSFKALRTYHPDLWNELIEMDKLSSNSIKSYTTLAKIEKQIQAEERQISIFQFGEATK